MRLHEIQVLKLLALSRHSIRATCLTIAKTFNDKHYTQLFDLKTDIYLQFAEYEINDQTAILTYKSKQDQVKKLFDNIALLRKDGSVIDLYVKRVSPHFQSLDMQRLN